MAEWSGYDLGQDLRPRVRKEAVENIPLQLGGEEGNGAVLL